jgi:hypothetical protein
VLVELYGEQLPCPAGEGARLNLTDLLPEAFGDDKSEWINGIFFSFSSLYWFAFDLFKI